MPHPNDVFVFVAWVGYRESSPRLHPLNESPLARPATCDRAHFLPNRRRVIYVSSGKPAQVKERLFTQSHNSLFPPRPPHPQRHPARSLRIPPRQPQRPRMVIDQYRTPLTSAPASSTTPTAPTIPSTSSASSARSSPSPSKPSASSARSPPFPSTRFPRPSQSLYERRSGHRNLNPEGA